MIRQFPPLPPVSLAQPSVNRRILTNKRFFAAGVYGSLNSRANPQLVDMFYKSR